jgi:endoglucanase
MDQTLVLDLNQAAIDGIRAAGATTQYIFAEGNAYSGAWSWTDNNDNLSGLTDSADKLVYEMHQYLDSDSSGTSETCVSSTIGKERLESATAWLKSNGKKGFIGEFAGGVNSVCETAVEGMLAYMSENSDVWMGAEWWSAGPWWGTYMYSLEPTDGTAYSTYLPILEKYFVSGTASASTTAVAAASTSSSSSTSTSSATSTLSSSSSTSAAVEVTTTPNSEVQVPSPSVDAVTTAAPSSVASVAPVSEPTTLSTVSVYVPSAPSSATTFAIAPSSTQSATVAPSSTGALVAHYYQCGGINWTGGTTCESPYTCKVQNPYYYQCV